MGVAAVLLVLTAIILTRLSTGSIAYPYRKKRQLVSPAERSFLGVLEQAVGSDHRIFAKVRVSDVIEPRPGLSRSTWQGAVNRIDRKHFDYVLCRPDDLSIVAAVELDDASHDQSHRQRRDRFLATACEAAGLPLVRVATARAYSAADLRAKVIGISSRREDIVTQ